MKKILSGVLAAASLLTMTVSASAAAGEKKVTAAGEVEYDVAVTAPKVVLNLIMPAKMSAALNPYGADIKLVAAVAADTENNIEAQEEVSTTVGIASAAYTITNLSTDYGIVIDASATTTVSAAKGDTWAVKTTPPADGVKSAQMALITAADAEALKTVAEADLADGAGVMMLDSAKAVKAKKFVSLGGASSTTDGEETTVTGTSAVIGFAGRLAESSDTKEVEWTEDDAINVALVLKVVAGPKGASSKFTSVVPASDISVGGTGLVLGALTADDTFSATLDASSAALNEKLVFDGYATYTVASDDTGVINIGTGANAGKLIWGGSVADGDVTLTYTLTPDAGGDDVTLTIVVTVENS